MQPNGNASEEPTTDRAVGPIVATVVGFLLLLGTGFFYIAAGLVVPFPYLIFVWAVWIVIAGIAVIKRRDWRVVAATPFVAGGLWFAILWAGERFLGWTA